MSKPKIEIVLHASPNSNTVTANTTNSSTFDFIFRLLLIPNPKALSLHQIPHRHQMASLWLDSYPEIQTLSLDLQQGHQLQHVRVQQPGQNLVQHNLHFRRFWLVWLWTSENHIFVVMFVGVKDAKIKNMTPKPQLRNKGAKLNLGAF